jgi:transposase InsO family protein
MRDAAIVRLRHERPSASLAEIRDALVREDDSYACSVGTISRVLTSRGDRSRTPRSDAGRARKKACSEEQLAMIVAVVTGLAGRTAQGDPIARKPGKTTGAAVPVELAIRDLEHRGLLAPGAVSPTWVYARLRERNLNLRGPGVKSGGSTVARRFRARRAGARFQFDGTPLGAYFIDASGDFTYLPESNKKAANKAAGKARAHILAWVDDHSRCCRLTVCDGETARNVIASARECFSRSDDPQRPMCGLPTVVYTDNGSGASSVLARRMFNAFGVELVTHRPYSAWSKGKVEALFRRTVAYQELARGMRLRSFVEAREFVRSIEVELNNKPMDALGGATPLEVFVESAGAQASSNAWRFAEADDAQWRELMMTRYDNVRVLREECCVQVEGERIALPMSRPFIDWIGKRVTVLLDTPAGAGAGAKPGANETAIVLDPEGRTRHEIARVAPHERSSLTGLTEPVARADELTALAKEAARSDALASTAHKSGGWIGERGRRSSIAGGVGVRPALDEATSVTGGAVELVDAHGVKRALLEAGMLDLFASVMRGPRGELRDSITRRELDHVLETGEPLPPGELRDEEAA